MSKRNKISYVKPKEPAFLARLKQEAGFKEGPTVETKKEKLDYCSDDSESEDLQPQVVVLNPGDLTAEEVVKTKKEAEEAPANLKDRVIFKKPKKSKEREEGEEKQDFPKEKKIKKKAKTHLLSFEEEYEDN